MIWFYQAAASLREFMALGGAVLWVIMFVLFLMWTFIFERLWYLYREYPARKERAVEQWISRQDTTSWYARKIRERMISEVSVVLMRLVGLVRVRRHRSGVEYKHFVSKGPPPPTDPTPPFEPRRLSSLPSGSPADPARASGPSSEAEPPRESPDDRFAA